MDNFFVYIFIVLVLGILTKIYIIPVSIPFVVVLIFIGLSFIPKEYLSFISLLLASFFLGMYITPSLVNLKEFLEYKPIYVECKVVSFPENF